MSDSDSELPPPGEPEAGVPPSDEEESDQIGIATMKDDGTLELTLRATADDGTFGEAVLVIDSSDERYAGMVAHLGNIQPGEHRAVPPFPAQDDDADWE